AGINQRERVGETVHLGRADRNAEMPQQAREHDEIVQEVSARHVLAQVNAPRVEFGRRIVRGSFLAIWLAHSPILDSAAPAWLARRRLRRAPVPRRPGISR